MRISARRTGALALLLVLAPLADARAQGTSVRVDVPIRQVILSNNDIRYAVPVSIGGGPPIDATLDTGSFGLRVLTAAVPSSRYESTGVERAFPYSSGAQLKGIIARATIEVGGAGTGDRVGFQVVRSVECAAEKPHCPVANVSAADYRIAGDGLPREGFEAILGISMRSAGTAVAANNPLAAMGDGVWIVVLPRPGEDQPGHLIINPDPEDLRGFTLFQLSPQNDPRRDASAAPGWLDGKLPGCLVAAGSTTRFCASTVLDSGAIGVLAESSSVTARTIWPKGTRASIEFSDGRAAVAARFVVGENQASHVSFNPVRGSGTQRLIAGAVPFFSYAIAYDMKAGTIGLRPRDDAAQP